MCATQDSPQPRPLRGEKHPFPSRSSCASMRCLCRPNWVCFFFSAFPQFLASTSLEWRQNQFSLSWGLTAVLDSLTAGSHWPNRACLGFRWCRFSTRPAKLLTGPHKAESGFTAFFPSLSRWKPGKQQICVHGNLLGAQSQDENLIGKKRSSLPWLSLASPPHFFSRPPSHFSNSVLRSLFFVYSTANFEAAYP